MLLVLCASFVPFDIIAGTGQANRQAAANALVELQQKFHRKQDSLLQFQLRPALVPVLSFASRTGSRLLS